MSNGIITDLEAMERVWYHTFYNELQIDPSAHPILLTESFMNPSKNRERMMESLFETFGFSAIGIDTQAVLSMYASGRTTGIVAEMGDSQVNAIPIYEGYAILPAANRMDLGGRDLTHYLADQLNRTGHTFASSADYEVSREIKEKLCYVAADPQQEVARGIADSEYVLPSGCKISVGSERFLVPEALFQPSLVGMEGPGIHQFICNAIAASDIDTRTDFYGNIVLSGGVSLMSGLPERLRTEITRLIPETKAGNVKIVASPERAISAWIGGSILASLSSFQQRWLTREMYEEYGVFGEHSQFF
eukprot:TRINITY_DN4044_c0_g1_i2.p1 TRINITY_DN4044_c0_g1~~TRINITY_DN4044_c0_g1_i2.p1  ORF type:complete len:304 (-),score=21.95 TRINITY_DN4044_c0_g1_i2:23-934(-)